MPYRKRRLQLIEIAQQSEFALTAYYDATLALRENRPERLWYSLHALLGAAAHLNSMLWPEAEKASSEAGGLRSALHLSADSPLAQPEIRETAHLNALVDAWTARGCDPEQARVFDPATSILLLYGIAIEAPPLLAAIAELRSGALAELQHMREIV